MAKKATAKTKSAKAATGKKKKAVAKTPVRKAKAKAVKGGPKRSVSIAKKSAPKKSLKASNKARAVPKDKPQQKKATKTAISAKARSPKSTSSTAEKLAIRNKFASAKKTSPPSTKAGVKGKPVAKINSKTGASKAAAEAMPAKKVYIPEVARPTGMYGGIQLSVTPKPFPKKSPYTPKEIALLKQALLNERARLRQELNTLEGMTFQFEGTPSESPGHSTHIAEHASDMQSNETNLVVRSLDEERLAQVEEALQRIEDRQQYGLCIACGDKIGIERLIAQPHAHLCMDCRRKYERERRI